MAHVAGGHHAADHFLRSAIRVALECELRPDEDSACLSVWKLTTCGVKDLDLGVERRPSRGPRCVAPIFGCGGRRPCALGRAVEVVAVLAERVHPSARELARQRRATREHDLERARVVARADGWTRSARTSTTSTARPRSH